MSSGLKKVISQIEKAENIILSTHRQADGDGLGAQIGIYYALKKLGKNTRILNVDATPKRYNFLKAHLLVESFEGRHAAIDHTDLVLIFDTNDRRLLGELYP